jgi:hypothetical protein
MQWERRAMMSGYGRIAGATTVVIAALAVASLLETVPEAVRWALLICSLGFIGATLRLHQLDARS